MRRVLVSQRVELDPTTGERRDALDQAWHAFLDECGVTAIPVPNHAASAERLLRSVAFDGVLLTGGNDLARYGGDAPERDEVEARLVRAALAAELPVLGVCRGMQLLLDLDGAVLAPVEGHAGAPHTVLVDGVALEVNSYHRFGCRDAGAELEVWARAEDGVVEAVRHPRLALVGIGWHPERLRPCRPEDVALFRDAFAGRGRAARAGGARP